RRRRCRDPPWRQVASACIRRLSLRPPAAVQPRIHGDVLVRNAALIVLVAAILSACSPSTPEQASVPPAPAPAQAAPAEAKPTDAKPAPAAAAGPVMELPVGECGHQSALPADQRLANTARWTTASEQDNFGFDVYRGDTENGEFTKLTQEPILGAGTSDETHKYEFRDDTIDPCKEYWYYVEG